MILIRSAAIPLSLLQKNLEHVNISIKTEWKSSKILPGFKNKGTKFDASFYRPISNLSEVSKLTEKAVHQQVYDYLSQNGLIHPDHHGFL